MPIKLITGQPGNGKTLYAVKLIQEAVKDGREVYSNINGLTLDVLPIPENARGELDWTMTPKGDETLGTKGALIVYDEAQKLNYFAYKSKEKLSANPIITELETHRHGGYDLIFITQSPKFLHLHLLELVNEHYHVKRPFNKKQAEIHMHRKTCMLPETEAAEKRAEDIFKFAYPPELFKKYKSTEIVTNAKVRVPKYMKKLFFIGGACLVGIIYMLGFSDNKIFNHVKGEEENKEFTSNTTDSQVINPEQTTLKLDNRTLEEREAERRQHFNDTLDFNRTQLMKYDVNKPYEIDQASYQYEVTQSPQLAGCAIVANKCTCYSQQATRLNISTKDCKRYMNGDRPFNPFKQQPQVNNNAQVPAQANNSESSELSIQELAKMEQAKAMGLI